jgi:hypothetical protein
MPPSLATGQSVQTPHVGSRTNAWHVWFFTNTLQLTLKSGRMEGNAKRKRVSMQAYTATPQLSSPRTNLHSPQVYARTAGFLYLLLIIFGAFGILYVPSQIVVTGDASTTVNNILASESLYRLGIVSELLTQVVFLFLAMSLYRLLRPVDRTQSMVMVVLVIVGVPIAMFNMINPMAALLLLNNPELTSFSSEQIQQLAMFFLHLREAGIEIASIFWGLWLFPFGYLVYRSGFIPRILGALLIIDGVAYIIDFFTGFLLPNFDIVFTNYVVGEIVILVWLLIRGVNVEAWNRSLQQAEGNA